jgi:hypothetical protein
MMMISRKKYLAKGKNSLTYSEGLGGGEMHRREMHKREKREFS